MRRALAVIVLVACKPPQATTDSANLAVASVESPNGVTLVASCTPTGPELCFNAIDDNCNGVIDEGCGLSTGSMQFTIAWGDSPADVNLHVTPPAGDSSSGSRMTGGLRLDRDCQGDTCNGQNVENVFFEASSSYPDPPRGRYTVTVDLGDPHGASLPVRVRFGARVYSKTWGADLDLQKRGDKRVFTFTL